MEASANDLGRSGHVREEDHHRHHREAPSDGHGDKRSDFESYHQLNHSGDRRSERDNMLMKDEKDQLESARAEMGQVREENQRLKLYLDQIMRDYKTLQTQFLDVVKQGDNYNNNNASISTVKLENKTDNLETDQESDLVSLSLGRAHSSGDSKKEHEKIEKTSSLSSRREEEEEDQRLKLGLECKYEVLKSSSLIESTLPNTSPTSSFDEHKEEEPGENWPPSKALKTMRSGEDEISQQNNNNNNNPAKKARVSVRARCDTPTMNDGCQWRKYGQKIAKGNPCPRAYYRCTVAPSCPVRKQVQRCADDMSILITTYEGTHNHPLPMAATAMASTTSAAAQMLLSGSSSSSSRPSQGPFTGSTSDNFHASNPYSLSPAETLRPGAVRSPFYFPTTSSSSSCPTITLDLTTSNPTSSSSSSSSLFTRFNPSTYSTYPTTRPFSSTNTLSFTSSDSTPISLPITSWGANNPGLLTYPSSNVGSIYNSYLQKNISSSSSTPSNISNSISSSSSNMALPDTIKALTTDPSFQSVLAAALKTIIAGGSGVGPGNPLGEQ